MSGQTPDFSPLTLSDTHSHVAFPQFDNDRDKIFSQLNSGDLALLIEVGTTVEDSKRALETFKGTKNAYVAVGVHPHGSKTLDPRGFETLETLLSNDEVVAVGEIGLDFYRDLSPRDVQRRIFAKQLEMALKFALPVIVHIRNAYDDVYEILKEFKGVKGVVHAFSGNLTQAEKFLQLGFHLGIGGPVTYRKNDQLRETVKNVPIERLLSETDCPYLPPVPFRGRRNEPLYVEYVVRQIAEQKGMDAAACSTALLKNAIELFALDSRGGLHGSI